MSTVSSVSLLRLAAKQAIDDVLLLFWSLILSVLFIDLQRRVYKNGVQRKHSNQGVILRKMAPKNRGQVHLILDYSEHILFAPFGSK